MNTPEVHERLLFLAGKERSAYWDEDEIDSALDTAQLRELQKYFGDDRAIQQGNVSLMYKNMQHIDTAIHQFKFTTSPVAVTAPSGTISIPSDTLFITGIQWTPSVGRGSNVPVLSEDEFINWSNSAVLSGIPCSKLGNSSVELYAPKNGNFTLTGITRPVKPSYSTPTDLNWDDSKIIDIIYVALQILGANASDEKSMQFGAAKSNPQV